jgi:hypothetical protein
VLQRHWPLTNNRLLSSLLFADLLFSLSTLSSALNGRFFVPEIYDDTAIALARDWKYFLVLAPPLVLVIVFKILLSRTFGLSAPFLRPIFLS